jgi:hypothetical protein
MFGLLRCALFSSGASVDHWTQLSHLWRFALSPSKTYSCLSPLSTLDPVLLMRAVYPELLLSDLSCQKLHGPLPLSALSLDPPSPDRCYAVLDGYTSLVVAQLRGAPADVPFPPPNNGTNHSILSVGYLPALSLSFIAAAVILYSWLIDWFIHWLTMMSAVLTWNCHHSSHPSLPPESQAGAQKHPQRSVSPRWRPERTVSCVATR